MYTYVSECLSKSFKAEGSSQVLLGKRFVFVKALPYFTSPCMLFVCFVSEDGMVTIVSQAVLALESNGVLSLFSSSVLIVFSDTGLTSPPQ